MRRRLPAIAAAAVLAACQDPIGSTPADREQLLYLVSGDDQGAVTGEPLGNPLVVEVRDVWGNTMAGVRITWTVTSGSGTFNTSVPSVTGADGRSAVLFTPSTARVELRAAIEGRTGSAVLFRITPPRTALYGRPSNSCGPPGCESIAFYADHSFALRYDKVPDYFGRYSRSGAAITLVFSEANWQATAAIRGDSLQVEYNFEASMDGFEDVTLLLLEGTPP